MLSGGERREDLHPLCASAPICVKTFSFYPAPMQQARLVVMFDYTVLIDCPGRQHSIQNLDKKLIGRLLTTTLHDLKHLARD